MLRICLIILLTVAAIFTPSVVAAEKVTPFNVDFFCGWGGHYRPMEWTPVDIGIQSNLKDNFGGSLIVSAQQDGLNNMNITHNFVLTPDLPLHMPLVTKFAFSSGKCNVNICNKKGRSKWQYDYDLLDFSGRTQKLIAVGSPDILIGSVGYRRFGMLKLSEETASRYAGDWGKVYIGDKVPRMVPWDWTGFASLDLLLLYDPDWSLFNEHQLKAIAQWVNNGGKLLIVLGSNPLPTASAIAKILPFDIGQAGEITLSGPDLQELGLQADSDEKVLAWPLTVKPTANIHQIQKTKSGESFFATACVGFGKVSVLTFDPHELSQKQRNKASAFWVKNMKKAMFSDMAPVTRTVQQGSNEVVISSSMIYGKFASVRTIELASDSPQDNNNQYRQTRFEIGPAQTASNRVMDYLYNIKAMRPLSIWWVILLLISLALLLGPVDYLLLKKLDKLPLTWVTCAFWIVAFSIGAYYGVQYLRAGKMQYRVVSVIDGISDTDCRWSSSYSALFAPRSNVYKLKGIKVDQWWSGISPSDEYLYGHNSGLGGRNIYCLQDDGGNLPYSLPVNQWTIQCLLNECEADRLPFDAVIIKGDQDEIYLTITNNSDRPISTGYVLFGDGKKMTFQNVPAHQTRDFSGKPLNYGRWMPDGMDYDNNQYEDFDSYNRGPIRTENAYWAQGSLVRTRGILEYMKHGAAVVCVEYADAASPVMVNGGNCEYTHIQLVRQVVFPNQAKER